MGMYLIAASFWSSPANWLYLGMGIVGLGIVIFVHELGHFLVAKACGVKCEKFYVGFDVPITLGPIQLPATLWKAKWGETEYGIGMIPLGGYVKMLGQDDNPANSAAEAERIRMTKDSPDGDGEFELDPRSYPAKSVPQRMAIISAGVIMNLIFAVIFGAIAYMIGVPHTPAVCGETVPGDSAWVNNLQFGDRFLQFGKNGRRNERMRFFRDLKYYIAAANDARTLDVLIQHADDSEEWIQLESMVHGGEAMDLPTIGVLPQQSLTAIMDETIEWTAAGQSELESNDEVRQVVAGGETHDVNDAFQLRRLLMKHAAEPLGFVVQRPDGEGGEEGTTHQFTIAPQPVRNYGMVMKMGAIAAIQKGSPGEESGFLPGDVLLEIDGVAIEDPFHVDEMLSAYIGQPVAVNVRRGNATVELTTIPRERLQDGNAKGLGRPQAAETIGVAYHIVDTIAAIEPGGPAEQAGLRVGDQIKGIRLLPGDGKVLEMDRIQQLNRGIVFSDDSNDIASFFHLAEKRLPPGIEMEFTVFREGEETTARVLPVASQGSFDYERGLVFMLESENQQARSWGEAWQLGMRETWDGLTQVINNLSRIRKLYPHMGGPIAIATIATVEASEGIPRLLTFLTLLSANLAILNFLPIPVLDGGHMMFLIYEGVFGKPMPERIAFMATMMGLCFILTLMILVFGLDIYRLAGFGG